MTAQAAGIYVARLWEAGQACREAAEGLQMWAASLAHPGESPENSRHD